MAVGGEIVEMSRMNCDVMVAQELNGEILVGDMGAARVRAKANDSVPAALGVQRLGSGMRAEKGLQLGTILAEASKKLCAKRMPLSEESWERGLGGRADGKIGVGDNLEAVECRADLRGGAGNGQPS